MAQIIEMPRYGANMDEGTVASWFVSEGDAVKAGDTIAEIAIEKLSNELLAPASGPFYPLVDEGETLPCGAIIGKIGEGEVAGGSEAVEAPVDEDIIDGRVVDHVAQVSYDVEVGASGSGKLTPKAAKLAEELGVDASGIKGTGYFDMITREDVRNAHGAGLLSPGAAPEVVAAVSVSADDNTRKLSEMEKMIAKGMKTSLDTMAQTTITRDMDVDNLAAYYESNKERFKNEGVKLSYTSLLVQIIGKALREYPVMRTVLSGNEMVERGQVNVGIAVDVPGGLVVPNIKEADSKDLRTISKELAELAEKSKNNKLTSDDLTGGTFTVTNLGMFGISYFTPVINIGESAILGLGAIRDEVVVKDGSFRLGKKMAFSLTHDHQVINGAPAARFLARIQELINEL